MEREWGGSNLIKISFIYKKNMCELGTRKTLDPCWSQSFHWIKRVVYLHSVQFQTMAQMCGFQQDTALCVNDGWLFYGTSRVVRRWRDVTPVTFLWQPPFGWRSKYSSSGSSGAGDGAQTWPWIGIIRRTAAFWWTTGKGECFRLCWCA